MSHKVFCATKGPKHHLFGFHDLIAFNKDGDKLLSLEVDEINHPPLPGEKAKVGYVTWKDQNFHPLGETCAFNYPQGARMQWIDNTHFIVNNRVGDHWGADIYDIEKGEKVKSLDSTCHSLTKDSKCAFGINYSRLHRLGGYGYIGLDDFTKDDALPTNDGIYKTNVETNETTLLVSIADVAKTDPSTSADNGFHHFVTHLCLSPNNKRIAFLHRFFLADGGVRTRLMTIGVDGKDIHCLACGFLSHFDWKDDDSIYIWGRAGSGLDAMRSKPIFSNPLVKPFVKMAKAIIKKLKKGGKGIGMSFLLCKDQEEKSVTHMAQGVITGDGHPMTCPTDNNICICDTYPDDEGVRELFIYDFEKNEKDIIGKYKRLFADVDMGRKDEYLKDVDPKILGMISLESLSFSRSGIHCDFHPRWNADGTMVAFDSTHEGTRQIYIATR